MMNIHFCLKTISLQWHEFAHNKGSCYNAQITGKKTKEDVWIDLVFAFHQLGTMEGQINDDEDNTREQLK